MIIFDSSTLILLAKIEILKEVSEKIEIVITTKVKEETTGKQFLTDAQLIKSFVQRGIIKVEKVKKKKDMEKLKRDFNIAEGEASSLLLAKMKGAILATDDGPTIKAAKILEVPFATAIHFLIRAYERKILGRDLALIKLDKLRKYGRYTSQIIEEAYKRIKGGI